MTQTPNAARSCMHAIGYVTISPVLVLAFSSLIFGLARAAHCLFSLSWSWAANRLRGLTVTFPEMNVPF